MEALAVVAGGNARAKTQLTGAEASLPTLGSRSKEAQVWLDAANGAVELGGGDAAHALSLFTEAANLAETMPERFDESRRLWLRQKQAISLFRLDRWNEADKLLNALLPRQIALHGPRDADTLLIELTQAQVLMGRGATAQAVAALDKLYPAFVAAYGADHRLTTGVLAARAQCLGQLERYDEAIRDGIALHSLAVSHQGENSWMAIATLSDVAESQCRAGHGEAGLSQARQALATAISGYGAKSSQAMAMMGEVAFCLIADGHAADAGPLLDAIDPNALVQLGAGPDFPAQVDVMRAEIALSAHNIPRARALLQRSAKVFSRPDADPYVKRWTNRLLAAVEK
jgi:tetratricopeptide (TPR) repeat protein